MQQTQCAGLACSAGAESPFEAPRDLATGCDAHVCFHGDVCAIAARPASSERALPGTLRPQRPEAQQEPDAELCCLPGLLVPVEGEHPSLLVLGALLTLRYLVPLLQQQVQDTSLKGSFGVTRKEMEVSPSTEQLVQVGALIHSGADTARTDTQRVGSRGRGTAQPRFRAQAPEPDPWFRSEVTAPSPVTSEGNAGRLSQGYSVAHEPS